MANRASRLFVSPTPVFASRPRNWALILGAALVALIALVASVGPAAAPQDPLHDNYIKKNYAGEWVEPPFAPLTVPGFILGSDSFGRDLYSQLLWAVRPTLTLVLLVAALRLTLGIGAGLLAGWSGRLAGRLVSTLISGALAVPILFVALCTITLLGASYGVWAFVLGLVITGWADSARAMREQTRAIQQRPYVEAARALGASNGQLLYRHVLPQVMPLVWTLFTFEASSALLATTALGFLGYFIHSIWLPLGDWTGIRAAGTPELGQMLASAFENRAQPWGMVLAGSAVFVMVLAFNLLGEGLRRRLTLEGRRATEGASESISGAMTDLVAGRLLDPLWPWRRAVAMGSVAGALLLVIAGAGYSIWRSRPSTAVGVELAVPGGQLWASERRDPYGTLQAGVAGPTSPTARLLWSDAAGLAGGPVIAGDGSLYLSLPDGRVCSLTPDGTQNWCSPVAASAVGAPALGVFGDIYVADAEGGLTAASRTGQRLWTVPGDGFVTIAGPIVGANNVIYYPTDGHLTAVSSDGKLLWRINLPTYAYNSGALTLSPDGAYVFFEDVALDAANGALLTQRTGDPFDRFFVASDGSIYLGGTSALLQWHTTPSGASIQPVAQMDARALGLGFRVLQAAGITLDQHMWLLFTSPFEAAKVVWFDLQGNLSGVDDSGYRNGWPAAIDNTSSLYLCGLIKNDGLECRSVTSRGGAPRWRLPLPKPIGLVAGSALVEGRLYVSTTGGQLFALDDPPK